MDEWDDEPWWAADGFRSAAEAEDAYQLQAEWAAEEREAERGRS